jgi:VTC domain
LLSINKICFEILSKQDKMSFSEILAQFSKITLDEMDNVRLMDRTDTKFSFHRSLLSSILNEINKDYSALEINGKRNAEYHTLYYDTKKLELYLHHQNGGLNRYKVRHRTYVDSDLGFLEVKFKNNKERTKKTRIKKRDVPNHFSDETEAFLKNELPFNPHDLYPAVWVNYKRITLVGKDVPERLTIDFDLEFVKDKEKIEIPNLIIAEVKQNKKQESRFIRLMKKLHIREGGISKYCLAIIKTKRDIKKNSFKPKLLTLQKIMNYVPTASLT